MILKLSIYPQEFGLTDRDSINTKGERKGINVERGITSDQK